MLTPTVQWILVALLGLLVVVAIVYFGSDLGSGGGGGDHSGLELIGGGRSLLPGPT